MNILQNIQDIIGQGVSSLKEGKIPDNLSGLLGPAALGGLAGALLTSKAARGIAGGALLAGGGAMLWNKYKDKLQGVYPAESALPEGDASAPAVARDQAERLVRALVFAAKSDGHIDDKEQQAIYTNLQKLNIGSEAQRLVQEALNEPLDPNLIARGVTSQQEALQLYALSCAVIDVDHFMERSYLDALAQALKIPPEVKTDLEAKLSAPA